MVWVLLIQTAFFWGGEKETVVLSGAQVGQKQKANEKLKNGDCSFYSLSELGNIYSVKEEQKNNKDFFGFGFEMFSTGPLQDWGE